MTTLQRSTRALLALGALTLVACSEQATNPNPAQLAGEPQSGKGGGGKPGGGGGAAPAAEIAFHDKGSLWVVNADGSGRTELLSNNCSHSTSSWAPGGEGTTVAPFRIVNWPTWASCGPGVIAEVDTVGGSVHVRNIQQVSITGSYYETGVWGDPIYGRPTWSPGAGAELALSRSALVDNEWETALYVIAASELPNPTPQLLYQPPPGCSPSQPAWHPAGTAVAFVEHCDVGGAGIKAIDRSTGAVTILLPFGVVDRFATLDWSPSGERLAFSDFYSAYTLLLGAGMAPELAGSGGVGVSWSPDVTDSRLAFDSSIRSKVKILDLGTGQVTTLGNGEYPDWRPF